ncbi:pyridoxal-phosphate dependent enzyme [Candidatus Saccharibacteria bacterium]|nr:pyridoxal-phosphate dependent enzyme [Candidatus Saccharibacteria bacterium]
MNTMQKTIIHKLSEKTNRNYFYIKRDDLIDFSFGGNKARKAEKFKEDIVAKKADAIVTYGSSESNHCRVIANMARSLGLKCYIISPEEKYEETYNSKMIRMFGARIIKVPIDEVSTTIDNLLERFKKECKPYFIPGGGHGNFGTDAYVDAYNEIKEYEVEHDFTFDYIFLASGTGTTQAGLICGQILNKDFDRKIIGISIARNKEKGEGVIIESIRDYLCKDINDYLHCVNFNDEYTLSGYNKHNDKILNVIKKVLLKDGIALNTTYTGKAYYGMLEYIKKNNIMDKNILFLNTGGLPLFFDDMKGLIK